MKDCIEAQFKSSRVLANQRDHSLIVIQTLTYPLRGMMLKNCRSMQKQDRRDRQQEDHQSRRHLQQIMVNDYIREVSRNVKKRRW